MMDANDIFMETCYKNLDSISDISLEKLGHILKNGLSSSQREMVMSTYNISHRWSIKASEYAKMKKDIMLYCQQLNHHNQRMEMACTFCNS